MTKLGVLAIIAIQTIMTISMHGNILALPSITPIASISDPGYQLTVNVPFYPSGTDGHQYGGNVGSGGNGFGGHQDSGNVGSGDHQYGGNVGSGGKMN
jgi:hypothetical protein